MMRTLRDKKTMHVVLWMLIFAFVVGFLFLAVGTKYQGINEKDPNLVAKVGDQKITYDELNQIYQPTLNRLYSSSDQNPDPTEINQLRQEVLDQLIDNSILNQTAQKLGITVSTEEVAASIQRMPYFLGSDGKFDKNRYFQILQQNQLTPQEFEDDQKQQILIQKINSILSDAVIYSADEIDHYAALLNRKLKANYLVLNTTKYEKNITPADSELKDYYQTNKSQFDHPERAKARHILITLPSGATPAEEATIQKTLTDYRDQILSGKLSFEKAAQQYSQDAGSRKQGGELGWLPRGSTVKEFEDQIFTQLKKGEISKPFKTQFGYHIVQLEDYEKAYESTFDEVKTKVLEQYQKEKALDKITALAEQISIKLQQNEDISKVASDLGLKTQTTTWFDQQGGIPGLKDSNVLSEGLADQYVGDWKGPLTSGDNHYFFQITEAKNRPLSADQLNKTRAETAERLVSVKQQEWVKDFLQEERKKLNVKTYLN
jgi:peptidyl-prolyl cis-trans isomerase D